jgi:hypothetical protein
MGKGSFSVNGGQVDFSETSIPILALEFFVMDKTFLLLLNP